MEIKEIFT